MSPVAVAVARREALALPVAARGRVKSVTVGAEWDSRMLPHQLVIGRRSWRARRSQPGDGLLPALLAPRGKPGSQLWNFFARHPLPPLLLDAVRCIPFETMVTEQRRQALDQFVAVAQRSG